MTRPYRAALAAIVLALVQLSAPRAATQSLPTRLSDAEYWQLIDDFSEPNGYFQSDNLVSNEKFFQMAIPSLKLLKRGGVYLGVAPDQNFTYILGVEPAIAFIVDIRRGNLHEHLLYKALFELSADRAEFLANLFSRPRPAGPATAQALDLIEKVRASTPDPELYKTHFKAVVDLLTKKHGFKLTPDDITGLDYVYGMFYRFGPDLTYSSSSFNGGRGGANRPSWGELQSTNGGPTGENLSYMGSEANFRAMKAFEEKNLLVPVVGNFAGTKALKAVGKYARDHGSTIAAFYVSNVEQYLFMDGLAQAFYDNVATLPLDANSVFIRSARNYDVLDPIQSFLKDLGEGRIRTYQDVTVRGGH
jgi:hypothetical protein